MTNAGKPPSIYVVYPAALFHGWEVATRHAEARAAREGGGIVKVENWFGDIEDAWEVPAQTPHRVRSTRAGNDTGAARLSFPRGLRRTGAGR
jgi:hypothetical protein